jgi:glycogen synthase
LRILHVIQLYHPVKSGAGRYFEEIGARLAADGHEVVVLTTDAYDLEHFWLPGRRRAQPERELHRGMQIVRLPVWRAPGPAMLYPAMRRMMAEISRIPGTSALLQQIARFTPKLRGLNQFFQQQPRFDLVHTANITLDFAILPARSYARSVGARFLCTPFVHLGVPGEDSLLRYYTMRHQLDLLRSADAVATMTTLEATALAQRGVDPSRLHIVGAGVDPAEVAGGDAARFRQQHTISGQLVLYIGALARDKGAIDTIEAMRRLWADGSEATLALIGAPLAHFEEYLATLADHERARLRLLPYADDQVKYDALAAADLLALPSRTDSFGIVFLEAWCYAVPVIGARAGGIPGVISDGVDGRLVEYADSVGLADTIGGLLADPQARQQLGSAGRAKVLREMTWDAVYQRALQLW